MLEKSMRAFGDLGCIVFNRRTNQLVGGHQRSKHIPFTEEVVIEVRYKKPTEAGTVAEGYVIFEGERHKYREVDWDEKTELAANIAANKHGGKFDLKILTEDLLELDALNIDMDLTGFTKMDLESLFVDSEPDLKTGSTELSSEEFETFKNKCPRCNFEWDEKDVK